MIFVESKEVFGYKRLKIGHTTLLFSFFEKKLPPLDSALAYYESESGQNDGHYGSALSALGEYFWRCEDYDNAINTYEKALKVTRSRFGENDGCRVISRNLGIVRKEMEEKQQQKG